MDAANKIVVPLNGEEEEDEYWIGNQQTLKIR